MSGVEYCGKYSDILLDTMTSEVDYKLGNEREKKQSTKIKEEELHEAGNLLRNNALNKIDSIGNADFHSSPVRLYMTEPKDINRLRACSST